MRTGISSRPWLRSVPSVRGRPEADFPTQFGLFRIHGFEGGLEGKIEEAIALEMGDVSADPPPLVRIHSQCLTGEVLGSLRCDCRGQLELAMASIAEEGSGLVIYEHQEGRGIGLMAKLKAYELQDQGFDTVEANVELGYKPDCREFELPAEILKQLGVHAVRLITNNPEKVEALESAGIRVVERISAAVEPEETFQRYLDVKREKMGHIHEELEAKTTN